MNSCFSSFGNTEQDERRQSFRLFEFRPAPVFRSLVAVIIAVMRLQVIMTNAKVFISNNMLHILIPRNSALCLLKKIYIVQLAQSCQNTCKHLKTEGVFVLHWGEEEKI